MNWCVRPATIHVEKKNKTPHVASAAWIRGGRHLGGRIKDEAKRKYRRRRRRKRDKNVKLMQDLQYLCPSCQKSPLNSLLFRFRLRFFSDLFVFRCTAARARRILQAGVSLSNLKLCRKTHQRFICLTLISCLFFNISSFLSVFFQMTCYVLKTLGARCIFTVCIHANINARCMRSKREGDKKMVSNWLGALLKLN